MANTRMEDSKRVMKNTLILYFRMLLVTILSFFTARITLQALGVQDFGIQNVVSGLVSFMGFITGTMSSASQRFLAFDLGKNDIAHFQKTFSSLVLIFTLCSFAVIILGATVGLWFFNTYLVIPEPRVHAALWAYIFAIISFVISLFTVPTLSAIVAYERMNIFGYVSIYEAIMKVLVVYALYLSASDKLVVLSMLNTMVQLSLLVIYATYCVLKLPGCRITRTVDHSLVKSILSFTGWNLFGSTSAVLCTSGISMLLNIFFGPLINAAKAIADKIYQFVIQFSFNFFQATAPQIVKSYSAGDIDYSISLVCTCSKFSFYIVFILSLPFLMLMDDLLAIWLGRGYVTPEMVLFSRWMLIYSLINVLEPPLSMLIRATGNIKFYQISVGVVTLMALPLAYAMFQFGFSAIYAIVTMTVVYVIAHIVRLIIVQRQVHMPISYYTKRVLVPILWTSVLSVLAVAALSFIPIKGWIRIIIMGSLALIIIAMVIYFTGLNNMERSFLRNKMSQLLNRYRAS